MEKIITNTFAPYVLAVTIRQVQADVQHGSNVCQPYCLGLNLSQTPILQQLSLHSVTGSDKSE